MYSITLDVGTVMHKDDLNDRKDMYDQAAAFLLNFRLLNRNRMSRDGNLDRSTRDSRNNMIYYSKRFPNVYMTSSFCNEIMNMVNVHLNYYESRWFDFGQLYTEPPCNESTIPWNNNNSDSQLINSSASFVHRVNSYNFNNSEKDFTNSLIYRDQLPNKLASISVPTPNSSESYSASTSPSDFEQPFTPFNSISPYKRNTKKSPEENNNKVHAIEDDNGKSESISSDSSKSETTDEKTVSYAEIIKHPKPLKMKQHANVELNIVEESKKAESIKSNRIPPSKKISLQFIAPDTPFLPNNQACVFCRNNGEEETVYRTHLVKDDIGDVICPILFRYTCPNCKATGTKAHTVGRCPLGKSKINKFNKHNSDK